MFASSDLYVFCIKADKHIRLFTLVINNGITTLFQSSYFNRYFHSDESVWKTILIFQ